jgi:hypothetical protein
MFGTTFVENPGMFSAKCVVAGDHSYLSVSIGEGAGSTLLRERFMSMQQSLPGWGLHILDVNLALGNLVDLVGAQGKEWTAAQKVRNETVMPRPYVFSRKTKINS